MLKRAKFPAIGLIKISLISICIFLVTTSCVDSVEPNEFNTDFKGYITCSMGNAVVRPDYSVWNINLELEGNKLVINPVAVRNKNFQHASAYEMLEGINLLAQKDGNVWYWGHWLPSSCTYTGSTDPILLTKLANIQSMILKTDEVYFLVRDGNVWKVKFEQCKTQTFKTPAQITELRNIVKITSTLALDSSGNVFPINETESDYGGYIPGMNDVVDVETSLHRSYIVKRDGSVWGWGRNWYLDLGSNDPNFIQKATIQITGLSEIVKISSNNARNLALKKDGTVWFWGYTGKDQNNEPIYSSPHEIDGLENVVLLKAGTVCLFMKSDGSVWYYDPSVKKLGPIIFPVG